MRKTRISMALAAALAGVGASTQVMAVNKSADDIGDAFIGPYYTTRGGWSTDFTVINTSDSTVPIKVRFHEANNSRDVLDFIVVLSPQDMVQAIVQTGPDGETPRLSFPAQGETSCVVPQPVGRAPNGSGGYFDFRDDAYTGENEDYGSDPWAGTIDRAREGYFTIIEMGAAIPGTEEDPEYIVPYNSNHTHLDCAAVIAAFNKGPNNATILKTYSEFERNVNALKASYGVTNVARGVQGSSEMVTLANFATQYSTLNPTPTWRYWANAQEAAALAAYNTAWANLNSAWTALNNANNDALTFCNDDNLLDKDQHVIGNQQAAVAVAPAERPGDCTGGAAALAAYDAAALAFNQNVTAHNNALANLAAVRVTIATTRVRNLIHAQVDPDWNYPNLDSGDLVAINNWDGEYLMGPYYCEHAFPGDWVVDTAAQPDTRGCPLYGVTWLSATIRGVDAVTMLLMTSDVINEWAVNPVTGASSDWVLTAPTKRFYTDIEEVYEGIGNYQPLLLDGVQTILGWLHGIVGNKAIPPFAEDWDENNFQSCDQVGWNVYNRDEGAPPGVEPGVSPQGRINLCNETNVLYFNSESMLASRDMFALPGGVAQRVDEAAPLGSNGWLGVDMTVSFNSTEFTNSQWHPVLGVNVSIAGLIAGDFMHWPYVVGMPYVGFMFKERNLGQAASYGGIVEHSYIREIGAHPQSFWDLWPLPPTDPCDFVEFFGLDGVDVCDGSDLVLPVDALPGQ